MNEETKNPVEETVETPAAESVETPAEETAEAAKEPKKAKKNAKADALAAELEAAKAEAAKTKDLFLRTAAEYDNYRKRTTKEREAAFGNGVAHAVEKLLPVIDTLEMAAAAATADENYKKGVTMTLTKAYAVLKDMGVEEIPAQDQPFDPNVHSAMMQQPTEGVEAGIVVQVFQKGYTLNGRVIRHAMVVVSA
jgi:molecular chaperone GrpE